MCPIGVPCPRSLPRPFRDFGQHAAEIAGLTQIVVLSQGSASRPARRASCCGRVSYAAQSKLSPDSLHCIQVSPSTRLGAADVYPSKLLPLVSALS